MEPIDSNTKLCKTDPEITVTDGGIRQHSEFYRFKLPALIYFTRVWCTEVT